MTASRMDTIEIREGRYFVRWWFFSGDRFDWLCALYRDMPDGEWTVQYRFRYYVDDKVNDSDDQKSWWSAVFPGATIDEAVVESKVQMFTEQVRALRIHTHGPCCEMQSVALRSSSVQKCFEILARQPWNHVIPTQRGGTA